MGPLKIGTMVEDDNAITGLNRGRSLKSHLQQYFTNAIVNKLLRK